MSRGLSDRAAARLEGSAVPEYLIEHVARATSPDQDVRDGYTCLAVSENKVMWDLLDAKANEIRHVGPSAFGYSEHWGTAEFRAAISEFGSTHLWSTDIDPGSIVAMTGAGATLEATFAALCDAGQGVLIPTPSYAGYWLDIETRIGLRGVPVPTSSEADFRLTDEDLDHALAASSVPIGALLVTNPPNPTGRILDDKELTGAVAWARRHHLPIVVNELYGLSTHGATAFTSIATLVDRGDDVHMIWGFSKDFAASGLRCGLLISDNADLIAAVRGQAMFGTVSGDTQHLLANMLTDEQWLDTYLKEMRSRLRTSYLTTTTVLDRHGVPYVDADAGLFVFADLRQAMPTMTWDAEYSLWKRILDETSVNLTPGSACRAPQPGFMRICFATVSAPEVGAAIDRALSVAL
ncbi:MAG: aminotransferase class I/II-fold pyridoxal phosphate-dependent enzyme [Acidimicrobiia bacterium]